ncbi:hypothetical protein A9Q84_08375 [Halobacteriovorax marinus]|uniref:Endonuclease/exonuclease/phosphatase domain-containing protein n=1 Tax=Halobacteriovorax marinus TaxID=97084 RepID=A0A1Y5FA32_9BACT|nr:hypothetical protein A9Q84_08375 [Halobacteriovorax marinus]
MFFYLLIFSSTSLLAWPGIYVPKDSQVLKHFGQTKLNEIDGDEINLFVWNIYKAEYVQWFEQYESQLDKFDLFLIQEMLTKPELIDIFSSNDSISYETATSFVFKKSGFHTGIATGSKVKTSWKRYLRSKKREPIVGTPKLTLFTKYPIKNSERELMVVNIHAINFVPSFSLYSQLNDAAKIIKDHDGPAIFAGDFNTWTLEKQVFLRKITQKLGFKEVLFKNDTRKRMLGWILDFIFVRDLEVIDSKVHDELDGSDHKAISAKLRYSEN